ncbi:unnamed protein product [Cyprideis torosa]|uniref:Uncharacterized protein n=1 Tax=Cyprideis torosa TaxID=163714 RepID=A0A7R8WFW5_9CRUS|nr:unnamed protein product [Cyprideis torosa]CAG0894621.1 unnamed protein product [Cyprideis torosa]
METSRTTTVTVKDHPPMTLQGEASARDMRVQATCRTNNIRTGNDESSEPTTVTCGKTLLTGNINTLSIERERKEHLILSKLIEESMDLKDFLKLASNLLNLPPGDPDTFVALGAFDAMGHLKPLIITSATTKQDIQNHLEGKIHPIARAFPKSYLEAGLTLHRILLGDHPAEGGENASSSLGLDALSGKNRKRPTLEDIPFFVSTADSSSKKTRKDQPQSEQLPASPPFIEDNCERLSDTGADTAPASPVSSEDLAQQGAEDDGVSDVSGEYTAPSPGDVSTVSSEGEETNDATPVAQEEESLLSSAEKDTSIKDEKPAGGLVKNEKPADGFVKNETS